MTNDDPVKNSGSMDRGARMQSVDARNRAMAQEAGLDRDLESQVPPIYGRFTTVVIAALAAVAVMLLLWFLI
jgi:hypothetical protein